MAGPSSVPSTVRAPIHESRRRSSRGCGLRSRATAAIFTSMGEYSAGMLDRVFSAVSDATRRAILARLAESAGWIEHYRRFWSDQLASLDAFVTGRDNAERSS